MNGAKTTGMDEIVEKMVKNRGMRITDWLLRIFNRCWESGVVPEDWRATCIDPIYKRNCDRRKCANYRGKIY